MPQTPNHGYNVPNEGEQDWHVPLNDNFRQYDTDIEIRDTDGNKGNYQPKAGAKFLATDTETVYVGDGSSWNELASTGRDPELDSLTSTGPVAAGTDNPVAQLHVQESIRETGATNLGRHVASVENTSTTTGADVLGLKSHHSHPGRYENFISFIGADEQVGTVQGDGAGGITLRGQNAVNLHVGESRAIAVLETDDGRAPNIVGGHHANTVGPDVHSATISGGGMQDFPNAVTGDNGTVAGGADNEAGGTASTISGGFENRVPAAHATVSGGERNEASGGDSTVAGGSQHVASGLSSVVGGGNFNQATGIGSTIPGGVGDLAHGDRSFAAGAHAEAADDGTFVWNDSSQFHDVHDNDTNLDGFSSAKDVAGSGVTGMKTFHVSATEGIRFVTGSTSNPRVTYISGGSAGWSTTSTRAAKTNVEPVDPEDVLAGVEEMPVSTWEYADEDGSGKGQRHIGPMAEDFHAAVDVGDSDAHINSINADGVALAAIKALARRADDLAEQVAAKDERIADLEADLAGAETTVNERAEHIDAQAARIAEQADRIDDLEDENEALRERLGALEDRVAEYDRTGRTAARPDD